MAHDLKASLREQFDAAVFLGTTRPVPPLRR
jgi:erythromycin esterase-like protein